jgi:TM2 domain-containing membrane protein YozV
MLFINKILFSIAAAPPFPGLRRFYEGRGFKQWTGNDSKALMKVFVIIIICFLAYLFCY